MNTEIKSILPPGHKNYSDIIKPIYKRCLYQTAFVCPCCESKFYDYKIYYTKLYEEKPERYDLRQFYRDFQIEWYDIITCPGCYFSVQTDYFTKKNKISNINVEKKLRAIKNGINLNFLGERNIGYVFYSHYLALICAAAYQQNHEIRARVWANLSWLYEDVEDKEMERFAAQNAYIEYIKLYNQPGLSPQAMQIFALSVAGMAYRAGDNTIAMEWVTNVLKHKTSKIKYIELANCLMELLQSDIPY